MADIIVLDIKLHGESIGTLTNLGQDTTRFAFHDDYINDPARPVLGLGFKDEHGALIPAGRNYTLQLQPFFSNLLPEGKLREYLTQKVRVNANREFFVLWALGHDLSGAITAEPIDAGSWPPMEKNRADKDEGGRDRNTLRFSLAGVQLKFSAVATATSGLTIPARGVGGNWIVKLPTPQYEGLPENEFSMMQLAGMAGISIPKIDLIDVAAIENIPEGVENFGKTAFIIERFDRAPDGSAVHIEDFAQVFGVFPDEKYDRGSLRHIAGVIAAETDDADIAEFVRRMTFCTLIGNGDMHLKNWSLIYPDRRNARLSPAYDLVSTIPYIRGDNSALKFSRTAEFTDYTYDEIEHLAVKAGLPRGLVHDTAQETVQLFMEAWSAEKKNLPMGRDVAGVIDEHLKTLPIVKA